MLCRISSQDQSNNGFLLEALSCPLNKWSRQDQECENCMRPICSGPSLLSLGFPLLAKSVITTSETSHSKFSSDRTVKKSSGNIGQARGCWWLSLFGPLVQLGISCRKDGGFRNNFRVKGGCRFTPSARQNTSWKSSLAVSSGGVRFTGQHSPWPFRLRSGQFESLWTKDVVRFSFQWNKHTFFSCSQ